MTTSFSIKKIFWLFLVIFACFSAFTFAEDDCKNTSAVASWSLFEPFLPATDLEIARKHLLAYCCTEREELFSANDYLGTGKCTNLSFWAQSPYWYDHLIDIGLRRLDAEGTYPWMTVDPQWKEWRDFLQNTEQVKNPQQFQDMYIKHFSQSKPYLFAQYKNTDYAKNFSSILAQASWFNLHDSYINYCFIAMLMYHQWLGLQNIRVLDSAYASCFSLAKARVRQESNFAVASSQYHAANLLVEGLSAYTKQFVQDRLMKLFDKFVAISSLFNTLAKQAPLSDTCTK